MTSQTCSHFLADSTNGCFKLFGDVLMICCPCVSCDAEFFRLATDSEIENAKKLGIIK